MKIDFVWDEKKSEVNQKKHGVSFEEAVTVFYDERSLLLKDTSHSMGEDNRFIFLGMSSENKMLVVVHMNWEKEEIVRIISARYATRTETNQYFAR